MKVAVIGGGITGLVTAYELQKRAGIDVVLFEADAIPGGKIATAVEGDLLIERGPDSVFTAKPWALDLIHELGLAHSIQHPNSREFSILVGGKLHPVPRPLASLSGITSDVLDSAKFLSPEAKERVLIERQVPPLTHSDESISGFFTRRFGQEFSESVAEPLLAGTHAGDPNKLSMAALYPGYLKKEKQFGSLTGSVCTAPSYGDNVGFITLQHGMSTLIDRLVESLGSAEVRTLAPTVELRSTRAGVEVVTPNGSQRFHYAVLTIPSFSASRLLAAAAPDASALLSRIRFASSAVVTLAYPRSAFEVPLEGNGFLVASSQQADITGCTWSSNKWAGRAPDDLLLMRVFLGRDGGLSVDVLDEDSLTRIAVDSLAKILGPDVGPIYSRVDKYVKALPQYEFGHVALVAAIEEALSGLPVSVAGLSYKGVGIPDCVRQGKEAAQRLLG